MQPNILKKNLFYIIIFTIVGLLTLQIPVTRVIGSKVNFTVYDALAPQAGAFIGTIPGMLAVFVAQAINFLMHGAQFEDAGAFIRFWPMLFAVAYFAKKSKLNVIIPSLAIVAFLINPIGRQVWYFTFFWTIPIIAYFFRERFLFARSLGATFSAHAVGSALWLWTFNLPVAVWISLVPVVFMERFLFAAGISFSYVLTNNLFHVIETKAIKFGFNLEPKYYIKLRKLYGYKIN